MIRTRRGRGRPRWRPARTGGTGARARVSHPPVKWPSPAAPEDPRARRRWTAGCAVRPDLDHSHRLFHGSLDEALTNLSAIGEGRAVGQLRTGSLESLRERNRLRVVDALRQRGAISRSDIARQTGLSRSTVSSLVADLQAEGLVVEREVDDDAARPRGRPPARAHRARPVRRRPPRHRLRPPPRARRRRRPVVHRHRREPGGDRCRHRGQRGARPRRRLVAEQLLEEAGVDRGRACSPPAWACPGPIDRLSGLVHSRAIIPSLDGIDTAVEMEMRLGMPVHLDNDANVGALGEATFGAGKGVDVMAYLRLSAGIGAGLVIGGRPFRGARGVAGEIGHVLVDPQGPICRCGNRGCLETFASPPALCELLRRSHGPMTVPELLGLAAEGDAGARRVIHDAGRVVGRAVADLCNFINPDLVIVGGDLVGRRRPAAGSDARGSTALRDPGGGGGRPDHRGGPRRPCRSARLAGARGPRVRRPPDRPGPTHVPSTEEEQVMRSPNSRRWLMIASSLCALSLVVAACGGSDSSSSSSGSSSSSSSSAKADKVAVLLPDTKSSVRWETADRPLLQQAFKAAGVPVEIQNAAGRQVHPAAAGRAGHHQWREGPSARQPRLGLRRRDRGQRQVPGREGHRLRPPDARRLGRLLRVVRQRRRRQAPGPGSRRLPAEGRRRREAEDRRAQRLADGQQRDAVRPGLQLGPQPAVQGGQGHEGRRPVRARLGQPEGADDLRADAPEGEQQDRRRARRQRRPRQRGHLGAQGPQAQADPGHRPGRDRCRASRTSSPATSA